MSTNIEGRAKFRIVVSVVVTFIIVNLFLLRTMVRLKESDDTYPFENHVSSVPVILIWYPPFNQKNEYLADEKTCGSGIDCLVTYDRESVEKSDALVFHYNSINFGSLPKTRTEDQLYVWWSGEKNHENNLKEFDNFFNLTFTYRRDSGVYAPYGSINIILDELRKAKEFDLEALLARKRKSNKIAAWAVSNCGAQRRMKLAKDMMAAGLDLDTFGKCFEDRELGDGANSESFFDALADYKFYLAFENSLHCKDYVTEKFWYNGLRSGAVPIVWGPRKEDVAVVAPKNSFIHVDDFKTVDDLVNYIIYLSVNDEAYKKHLLWRTWISNPELTEERFRLKEGEKELHSFCKLCQIIYEQKQHKKTMIVPSLRTWWWEGETKQCLGFRLLDFAVPQDGVRELLNRIPGFHNANKY